MALDLLTLMLIRRLGADRDANDQSFSDPEIEAMFNLEDGNIKRCAALMLETAAGEAAMVARIIKTGTYSNDRTKVPGELRETAKRYREEAGGAGSGGYIEAPDRVFTTDSENGSVIGTMTGW